ncbi:MAG TPA: nuclear transport factor 2 family protein [Solirubrobacteraceae bacterium]|jgi:ketosteroid isomerase-like protein|nr:nuclear transport factor 2 family protein [Solirubrobacteraceae bacterium]
MSESNAELARLGFEAIARGDLDAIEDLLDREVQWHGGHPGPWSCHNREDALDFIRQARSNGRVGELVDVIEAGERVVVVMRPPGALADSADELRANVTTFRDGKVVEMQAYPSVSAALQAVGRA